MKNWFSRAFSSEKDPLVERIFRDSILFDSIKYCNSQISLISQSAHLREKIIEISERINWILQGQQIHKIISYHSELDHLSIFLDSLYQVFELIPPNSAGSISIFNASLSLLQILDYLPHFENLFRVPIHLLKIPSIYPDLLESFDFLLSILLCSDSLKSLLCSPEFIILLISEIFPCIELSQ